ncbi:ABC transporter permease [Microvirga sp. W0021]|uniref:ABC transporter permease n=1 Tax=Hohaiivirga grylli TaxID=3133970 RepID=A0ABV0BLS5_9HYPH
MPRKVSHPKLKQVFLVILVFILATGFWEWAVRAKEISELILPGPLKIGERFVALLHTTAFWGNFGVTMYEVLAGYALGIVIAVILGVAISQLRILEQSLMPYVVAFQTIPSIALAPIFLHWFGYGLTSKIVMAAIISFFPILVNVIVGLQASNSEQIEMLRSFGASSMQILLKVRVPNAMPYLFAGLNLGAVFALVGAIVAEFVGGASGLGKMILQFNDTMKIADMFAVLIVLAIIGMSMHCIIACIRRKVIFWAATR